MIATKPERQAAAINVLISALNERLELSAAQLVGLSIEIADMIEAWQANSWKALFAEEIPNPHSAGLEMRQVYQKAAEALARIEANINFNEPVSQQLGKKTEGIDEIARAGERLARLRADFEKRWPIFDVAELQAASARVERGEYLTAEELRRELLGED